MLRANHLSTPPFLGAVNLGHISDSDADVVLARGSPICSGVARDKKAEGE